MKKKQKKPKNLRNILVNQEDPINLRARKPRNFKSDSKRNDQTRKDQPRKTSAKLNRSAKKPVNGNLKSRPENTPAPLPDDNIGNKIEAPKDKPKEGQKTIQELRS